MRNLYLLRFLNIDHATYRWFSYEFSLGVDILNDLVEIGWVRFDGRFFTLHPLVEELVKTDLKPCEENCIGVYHIVNQYIQKTIEFTGYDDAAEYEFEKVIYVFQRRLLMPHRRRLVMVIILYSEH